MSVRRNHLQQYQKANNPWHDAEKYKFIPAYFLLELLRCLILSSQIPPMPMLTNLTLYVSLTFFVSEVVLSLIRKSKTGETKIQQDRNTLRLLWVVILVAMIAGTRIGFMFPRETPYATLRWSGLGVFIAGFVLRWSAILQLGKGFTVDVSIGKEHQLMQSGLYSYIRHPSYLGLVLEFLGYALLINSWYPLVIINVPVFIALHHRMNVEEALLTEHFGTAYQQYMQRTKRLVPFLY